MAIYRVSIEKKVFYDDQQIEANSIDEAIEKAQDNIDEGLVSTYDEETLYTEVTKEGKLVYSDKPVIKLDIYDVIDEVNAKADDFGLFLSEDNLYTLSTKIVQRVEGETDFQDLEEEITTIIIDELEHASNKQKV